MSNTEGGSEELQGRTSQMDLWERIKQFNSLFDYKDGDDLGLWLTIMEEQVEEIREHLDEGREEKALNEFIDCILVGQQAPMLASDHDVDTLLLDRIHDIEERVDDVQRKYRGKHEQREVPQEDLAE